MRIALVTEFYYPHLGGVTEHVYHLAKHLNAAGHTAVVITSRIGGAPHAHELLEPEHDRPLVYRIGTSRVVYSAGSFARVTTGLGLRRQIRAVLCRERIDLMHVHGGLDPVLGLVAPLAAGDLGIPTVATFHSWFRRSALLRIFRHPLQRRLERYRAVIAVSQPVVDAHNRYFHADWEIIPNGVDTQFFRPRDPAAIRDTRHAPELLFLGRLDPRNGLDTLLAAMPKVRAQFPDIRLTVAGDGPLRPMYQRLATGLGECVRFVGGVNGDRPHYYSSADLYLCPTTKASFGVTLLEAMACGTPLAVSDITGFRELVAEGDEAVLIPKNRPEAWATSILKLLSDERRRARMSAAGVAKAEQYSWLRIGAQILSIYQRVTRCSS
jgi:phosphatidylinositol alpha-mannosyltransferase